MAQLMFDIFPYAQFARPTARYELTRDVGGNAGQSENGDLEDVCFQIAFAQTAYPSDANAARKASRVSSAQPGEARKNRGERIYH